MADHALATVSNPTSALTDFTLIVDLSDMPANWWSAVTSSDGTRGRVYKGDGSTRLACDWIDFDDTAETGLLRVLWSGTLASTGTQELWIEPPVSGNATVAAADTYGSDNAYDSSWEGYWPLVADFNDRTSNGNNGTGNGSISAGGGSGPLGGATDFDGTDDAVNIGTMSNMRGIAAATYIGHMTLQSVSSIRHAIIGSWNGWSDYVVIGANGPYSNIEWWFNVDSGTGIDIETGTPSTSTIYHVSGIFNSGDADLRVNGASIGTASTGQSATPSSETVDFYLGRLPGANSNGSDEYIDADMSHVSMHSTNRADAWVDHESDQIRDNSTFWGTWSWETAGGGTTQELIGTLSGTGGVSAALEVERLISATASATGTVDAVLAVSRLLSAAVSGTAGSTADLDVTRALSASTSGTGDLSGLLTVTRSLAAQADGVSTLSGAIAVTRALAGTLAATGGTDATLTVENIVQLAGTLSGTAGADAALTIRRALSGDLETTGDVAAALQVIRRLSGEIAGQAGASGSLQIGEIALAVGRVSVALEAKLPGAAFTSTTPSATFDVTAPGVTWEGN